MYELTPAEIIAGCAICVISIGLLAYSYFKEGLR